MSHDLSMIRAERRQTHPDDKGVVGGDVEAMPAPADADAYVIVKKKQPQEGQQKQ